MHFQLLYLHTKTFSYDVMFALQKDSAMRFGNSLCDTFKYDSRISAECPWLKGNDDDSDDDLDGVYMEMPPEDQ